MPLFEDYDKVHIGSVTRSQFHRVLSELELGGECIQYKCSFKMVASRQAPTKPQVPNG